MHLRQLSQVDGGVSGGQYPQRSQAAKREGAGVLVCASTVANEVKLKNDSQKINKIKNFFIVLSIAKIRKVNF